MSIPRFLFPAGSGSFSEAMWWFSTTSKNGCVSQSEDVSVDVQREVSRTGSSRRRNTGGPCSSLESVSSRNEVMEDNQHRAMLAVRTRVLL